MLDILVCDRDKREEMMLKADCRFQAAALGDWEIHLDAAPLEEAMAREQLINLLYYEFQGGQLSDSLRAFRQKYEDAMVMLITDKGVSPLEYLRPGLTPDSLLLRPIDKATLQSVNCEFMSCYYERWQNKEAGESFVVDTRAEKIFIPYCHIYYFEARDKKLYARLKYEEYAFYDTMDELERKLPSVFQRCHRSYIVNSAKILRVVSRDGYIELADHLGVPMSRKYKSVFLESIK